MNTSGRRQRQAKQGFTHLGPLVRPHYKKRSAEASARHLARVIATERRMGAKKK